MYKREVVISLSLSFRGGIRKKNAYLYVEAKHFVFVQLHFDRYHGRRVVAGQVQTQILAMSATFVERRIDDFVDDLVWIVPAELIDVH